MKSARELIEAQQPEQPERPAGPRRAFIGGDPMRRGRPTRPPGPGRTPSDALDLDRPEDAIAIRDFLLLELVRGQGTFYEKLVDNLVNGQPLEPGQLQHFVDEVNNVETLGDAQKRLAEKIKLTLASQKAAPPAA